MPGIDNGAHIGGLVGGLAMVYLLPDGRIASRSLTADKRDLKREELEAELEAQNQEPLASRQ